METLNMSKLNLSSVQNQDSKDMAVKIDIEERKHEPSFLVDDQVYSEYDQEIWDNLLEQEAKSETIHLHSPQLEFRGTLVQQLRDATKKLGFTMATLHSAVSYLDHFMDAHRLRADRLTDVAMACFSLAAKSEEKFSRAPTLKTLSRVSGVKLCGSTFRQLEWMVGRHVRWRLLAPTAVSFAALLAKYVVTDEDLTTRHPKFVRRLKRDGAKLLEAYLDLTLSDVRLACVRGSLLACACVMAARAACGRGGSAAHSDTAPWSHTLAARTRTSARDVAPLATLLYRMMEMVSNRDKPSENSDIDQGYSSSIASPNLTPSGSPSSVSSGIETYRHNPTSIQDAHQSINHSVGHQSISSACQSSQVRTDNAKYRNFVDNERVDNSVDYKYCRSRMLIEGSDLKAVKRGSDAQYEVENKKFRMSNQTQVVL